MIFQYINQNWTATFTNVNLFILWILLFLVFLVVISIFLKIGLSFTDAKKTEFSSVFATSLLITIVFIILTLFIIIWWLVIILALLLMWLIIAKRHDITFIKAILVTVLALIAFIVIVWLIGLIFGFTLFTMSMIF
ncbi:MAG: hypothetical protein ACTSVV_05500 [Promethearchaeota archaeon]